MNSPPSRRHPIALAVRGTPAWRIWVDRLAHSRQQSSSQLVEEALERLAAVHRFPEPRPPRLGGAPSGEEKRGVNL